MARGPIIRTLEILQVTTALCAVGALVIALSLFSSRLDVIQQSRQKSAQDTCNIIRSIVFASPSAKRHPVATTAFLANVGLGDCHAYGIKVRYSH